MKFLQNICGRLEILKESSRLQAPSNKYVISFCSALSHKSGRHTDYCLLCDDLLLHAGIDLPTLCVCLLYEQTNNDHVSLPKLDTISRIWNIQLSLRSGPTQVVTCCIPPYAHMWSPRGHSVSYTKVPRRALLEIRVLELQLCIPELEIQFQQACTVAACGTDC